MRIVITTLAHLRPQILGAWINHIQRIKESLSHLDIEPHVCISDESALRVVRDKASWNRERNYPLGMKANKRLKFVKGLTPDYVLFLGSDDFIDEDYLSYLVDMAEDGFNVIEPLDIYYYDTGVKIASYSPGYVNHRKGEGLAVGRMIKASILDQLDWTLWNDTRMRGIDADARDSLAMIITKKHVFSVKEQGLMLCDVKGPVNLSPYVLRDHHESIQPEIITNEVPEIRLL